MTCQTGTKIRETGVWGAKGKGGGEEGERVEVKADNEEDLKRGSRADTQKAVGTLRPRRGEHSLQVATREIEGQTFCQLGGGTGLKYLVGFGILVFCICGFEDPLLQTTLLWE